MEVTDCCPVLTEATRNLHASSVSSSVRRRRCHATRRWWWARTQSLTPSGLRTWRVMSPLPESNGVTSERLGLRMASICSAPKVNCDWTSRGSSTVEVLRQGRFCSQGTETMSGDIFGCPTCWGEVLLVSSEHSSMPKRPPPWRKTAPPDPAEKPALSKARPAAGRCPGSTFAATTWSWLKFILEPGVGTTLEQLMTAGENWPRWPKLLRPQRGSLTRSGV